MCCSAKILHKVARHGRTDEDFPSYVSSGVVYVHEDVERTNEIIASAIAYQRTRCAERGTDRDTPKPALVRLEDLPWERHLVGTPGELVEGLVTLYEEVPYEHLYFWGRLPDVTHEQALANMRLFASEVAPRVRETVEVA